MTGLPARRAKIVATLGPSSCTVDILEEMIRAGMDVARLNFSHGTHEDHARTIRNVREAAEAQGKPVALLLDLQGPKIRVGDLPNGPISLEPGHSVDIVTGTCGAGGTVIPTTYEDLPNDVRPGDTILLDDGLLRLTVTRVGGSRVTCQVVDGGLLKPRKGINLPGVNVSAPALTEKDEEDLIFGLEQGVDFIALSFVRKAGDLARVRTIMGERGVHLPLIAKLEKPEALADLPAIMAASDGVMVARGDLGVETSPEEVPIAQKSIIRLASDKNVPVITATQMLESMTHNPRPTRAEASDVANAIFDGTDAVMLSGETAAGKYPVETIRTMDRIVRAAEENYLIDHHQRPPFPDASLSIEEATCLSATEAARVVGARFLVAFTRSGGTARFISKTRPRLPILALTPDPRICRMVSLFWGVTGRYMRLIRHTDELFGSLDAFLLEEGLAGMGEMVVVLAGVPAGGRAATNMMQIHTVGHRSTDTERLKVIGA